MPLCLQRSLAAIAGLWMLTAAAVAGEFCLDMSRPACGKVCKLICETKKLTSTCYGCKCKDICLPEPSRPGCEHCAVCCGKSATDTKDDGRSCPPKCKFYWRDWFACGCAQPRTIHVLTKYQAEKKVCWYHWEVVDAACNNSENHDTPPASKKSGKPMARSIYKSAPTDAQLGDVLPVSDSEWVKLVAFLPPDETAVVRNQFAN